MNKIITIAQRKGGIRNTKIAAQLLIIFLKKILKLGAIDIDRQGTLDYGYNLRKLNLKKNFTCIDFLNVLAWKISNEIAKLSITHDLIIIDIPPHNEIDTKSDILADDLVVTPLQTNPTDLCSTQETIEFSKKEHKEFHLIINRSHHNSKLAKLIPKKLPEKLLKNSFGNRVSFSSCMLNGSSILENVPNNFAINEV